MSLEGTFDFQEIIRGNRTKTDQKIADLKSHAKDLSELLVTERFRVDEVIAESYDSCPTTTVTRKEVEREYGVPFRVGGFASRTVLTVSPDREDIPVNTLVFLGASAIRAGDYISARIPRLREEKVPHGIHDLTCERFYLDRDFASEEFAIELNVLSQDGKVLRTERSVDYNAYKRT